MKVKVRVTPGSRQNSARWDGEWLRVKITAPPVAGAANQALIRLLAERLDLSVRQITLLHGAGSREKLLEISGLTEDELRRRLAAPTHG
jgi:uncharacterized protein (TIGR00251 family)